MLPKSAWAHLIPQAGTMCLDLRRCAGWLCTWSGLDDLPGKLPVHVECLLAMPDSLQYAFRVEQQGQALATMCATLALGAH